MTIGTHCMHLVALRSPVFHFRVLAPLPFFFFFIGHPWKCIEKHGDGKRKQSTGGLELSRDASRSRLHINQPLLRAKKVEKSSNEFWIQHLPVSAATAFMKFSSPGTRGHCRVSIFLAGALIHNSIHRVRPAKVWGAMELRTLIKRWQREERYFCSVIRSSLSLILFTWIRMCTS